MTTNFNRLLAIGLMLLGMGSMIASPQTLVDGALDPSLLNVYQKWQALGGESGQLGQILDVRINYKCSYVTFERGVIVQTSSFPNPEKVLFKNIADKWLSLGGPDGVLGCPTSDETTGSLRDENTSPVGRDEGSFQQVNYQFATFEGDAETLGGEVVFNPDTGESYRLSPVFASAWHRLSPEAPPVCASPFGECLIPYNIGLPVSDPLVNPAAGISELQYFRPLLSYVCSDPSAEGCNVWWTNVLEMHTTPPTLYVARYPLKSPEWRRVDPADECGGGSRRQDCIDRQDTRTWRVGWFPPDQDGVIRRISTPKWEKFSCDFISGPCRLTTNYNTPPIRNTSQYCFGERYNPFCSYPCGSGTDFCLIPIPPYILPTCFLCPGVCVSPRTGPPQWQTIMYGYWQGGQWRQRPFTGDAFHNLMQEDPNRALQIVSWGSGAGPGREIWENNRPVYWYSSKLEGIVTNSHRANEDWRFTHSARPDPWFLGSPVASDGGNCGGVSPDIGGSLCVDWNLHTKPDPEYTYLLGARQPFGCRSCVCGAADCETTCQEGNFSNQREFRLGNIETEIEQWQIPGGFRPEIGDRIFMKGRWVIDCAHADWHTELHPIELLVTSHGLIDDDNLESTEAKVVVTSAWTEFVSSQQPSSFNYGSTVLEIYPPARPFPEARLVMRDGQGIEERWDDHTRRGLNIQVERLPRDNPTHVRVTITRNSHNFRVGCSGDQSYDNTVQWVSTFRLFWQ